eukprot:scaffold282124_cov33-Tisochrysis_lutea.AAC.1
MRKKAVVRIKNVLDQNRIIDGKVTHHRRILVLWVVHLRDDRYWRQLRQTALGRRANPQHALGNDGFHSCRTQCSHSCARIDLRHCLALAVLIKGPTVVGALQPSLLGEPAFGERSQPVRAHVAHREWRKAALSQHDRVVLIEERHSRRRAGW